ncbi:DUF2383 domain-containing protein [Cytophagaceae bacterium ABcell3]|nr:DUF2383 domain-containing protein [Cytophagaceae bacterium ABcell3]
MKEDVHNLMKACYNREQFYKMAAEDVLNADYIPVFNQLEFQSRQFISELEAVTGVDFTLREEESFLKEFVQMVNEVKETFYRADAKKILEKALSAEKSFLSTFNSVKLDAIPEALRQRQIRYAEENYKKLKKLYESQTVNY